MKQMRFILPQYIFHILHYQLQNKETKKGTDISKIIPCRIAIGIIFFPEYLLIIGNITSIELIPATEIGASFPKNLEKRGAPNNDIISLTIFANNANVPNSVAT